MYSFIFSLKMSPLSFVAKPALATAKQDTVSSKQGTISSKLDTISLKQGGILSKQGTVSSLGLGYICYPKDNTIHSLLVSSHNKKSDG